MSCRTNVRHLYLILRFLHAPLTRLGRNDKNIATLRYFVRRFASGEMTPLSAHKDAHYFSLLWDNKFLGIGKASLEPRDDRVGFF